MEFKTYKLKRRKIEEVEGVKEGVSDGVKLENEGVKEHTQPKRLTPLLQRLTPLELRIRIGMIANEWAKTQKPKDSL